MKQYVFLRLLLVVVGFFLVTFYEAFLQPESRESTPAYLFSILTAYGFVGIASLLTFEHWADSHEVCRVQVLVDFGLLALLVWSTGGVVSFFVPLLFVTFVSATALVSSRGALLLASVTTLFLVGNTFLYAAEFTPPWGGDTGELDSSTMAYLVMSVLALYGLSVLGSRYSSGLRVVEHLQLEVIENMAEGVLVTDRENRVKLANEGLRELLELSAPAESFRERNLAELIKASSALTRDAGAANRLVEAVLSESRIELGFTGVHANGKPRPIEATVSVIVGDDGAPRYRAVLFVDRTLQREVEEKERRIDKLEDLRELAMGLAHEIRNPLASIRGCVQELARLSQKGGAHARLSEIVQRESDRLDRIVENFQQFARSTPQSFDCVDFVEAVDRAVVLLENRSDLESRILSWERPSEDIPVMADAERLMQVLLNLGINAIQATDPTSGRIDFAVLLRPENTGTNEPRTVELLVSDNGNGIPDADQKDVFQPFVTTKKGGSGLGLSIVEKIVQEHGGQIEVGTSDLGGACFTVRLEVDEEVLEDEPEVEMAEIVGT